MRKREETVFLWMAALFLTSLLIANLIGSLLFSFKLPWGTEVLLSAGIIPFPVTFLLTDLLNEFYGKQGARFVTLLGFGMSILVYLFLIIGERLPVDPISQFTHEQFSHFSQLYTSMFLASLSAYVVGQLLDIQIFHIFRAFTKHRFIWLRATGSTVVSQLFDSIIVTFVAFGGAYGVDKLWQLALGNYTWKFVIAVGITPLLYLGHALLSRLIHGREVETVLEAPEYLEVMPGQA